MKKEVTEIQKLMYEEGMDIYYIPSSDFHASEYMHPYFKCREFVSGFDGSAGDMIITAGAAYLWTDSRYFLQAEEQLRGSGIELMKMREEGVPTIIEFVEGEAEAYMKSHDDDFTIGCHARTAPARFMIEMQEALPDAKFKLSEDLVDRIWQDRPEIIPSDIYEMPLEYAGESAEKKLKRVREAMAAEAADYLLLSDLSETAWLFNLRGNDVEDTPVFYSFTLITPDDASLYIMDKAGLPMDLEISDSVEIRSYDDIYADLSHIEAGSRIWLDTSTANFELYSAVTEDTEIYDARTPVSEAKMIKNPTEIAGMRRAHVRDGAAVTEFIKWVKEAASKSETETEISAADHLETLRANQDKYMGLSFPTIAGYGPNGAIVHYEATPESNAEIYAEGFLLVDSGAQYEDGTTDITRTIALGDLSDEMKADYTYVLKSHIAYAMAGYTKGMSGGEFDAIARKPLSDAGLGFKHGISHGVGFVLGVHEDAAIIRPGMEEDAGIKAGMIMSDEPGVYKEGLYGIRIENLVLFKDDGRGGIINEPLTCVPYERDAIVKELLTEDEIKWINDYHKWVREQLRPVVDPEVKKWLAKVTEML